MGPLTPVPIPQHRAPLYLDVLRHTARGLLNEDGAAVGARLAQVQAGSLYRKTVDADERLQSSYGRLRPGLLRRRPAVWYVGGTPADPA